VTHLGEDVFLDVTDSRLNVLFCLGQILTQFFSHLSHASFDGSLGFSLQATLSLLGSSTILEATKTQVFHNILGRHKGEIGDLDFIGVDAATST